ncbi:MAG TPA: phosphatase PAP2 family protein [Trueperaceae bacterium]|nr:phosphatase PAP2 family protein [Trueperaceae bacterium]
MGLVYALQSAASPALDRLMLAVTNLGSEQAYVALLVVAFVAVDAKRGRSLALTLLAGFYLNQVLKHLFATQRPYQIDPTVARSEAAVATAPGSGFPSGHAQGSATFWSLAAAYVRKGWFTALSVAVVALVSVSRVYLGVHLPIDIVGGLAFGLATTGVALYLQRRGVRLGRSATVALGLLVPLGLHLVAPTEESGLLLGAFAAFAVGPELYRHDTSGPVGGRVALAALALVVVFGALLGSSVLLPEEVKESAFGSFARFLVIGGVGTVLMPWLGRVLRLTPAAPRPVEGAAARPGTAA